MTPFAIILLLLGLLGGFMLLLDKKEMDVQHHGAEPKGEVKIKQVPALSREACGSFCQARLKQRRRHHGGVDFLSNDELLQSVLKSRAATVDDLKLKYGADYFPKIFESSKGKLRQTFVSAAEGGPSLKRFQRKLQMKILQVQAGIYQENAELMEDCNCNNDEAPSQGNSTAQRRRRLKTRTALLPPIAAYFSNFVWATGGHSAAAAHGNLHNESYTATMEAAAKDAFDSIGIKFEGRNYGMGSMQSAPILSLCNEAVYGTDGT
jgi:hypothetical protein